MIIRKYSAALLAVFFSFATSIAVAQSENPIRDTGYFTGSTIVKGVNAPLDSTNEVLLAVLRHNFLTIIARSYRGLVFVCNNASTDEAFTYNAELVRNFSRDGHVQIRRESATSSKCEKMSFSYYTPGFP